MAKTDPKGLKCYPLRKPFLESSQHNGARSHHMAVILYAIVVPGLPNVAGTFVVSMLTYLQSYWRDHRVVPEHLSLGGGD